MTGLHDLLELATDRVEPAGLAPAALATARRRRRTRRGLAASAAVVVLVAGIVAAGQLGGERAVEPAPTVPTVTPDRPPWDPRTVDRLPPADADVAPLLPATLRVPDLAPRIEDDPVDRAVLAVDDGADILLLDEEGRWHCVVVPGRTPADPALSEDGTRLAVGVWDARNDHVVVVDLATGDRTPRLGFPSYAGSWTLGEPDVRSTGGWDVRPVAQLADGTGLLRVAGGSGGWRIVHWDPTSDRWSLVTRTSSRAPVTFAADLVGAP